MIGVDLIDCIYGCQRFAAIHEGQGENRKNHSWNQCRLAEEQEEIGESDAMLNWIGRQRDQILGRDVKQLTQADAEQDNTQVRRDKLQPLNLRLWQYEEHCQTSNRDYEDMNVHLSKMRRRFGKQTEEFVRFKLVADEVGNLLGYDQKSNRAKHSLDCRSGNQIAELAQFEIGQDKLNHTGKHDHRQDQFVSGFHVAVAESGDR